FFGDGFCYTVIAYRIRFIFAAAMQPILVKIKTVNINTVKTKWMKITFTFTRPINKFYSQFESRLGCTHHLGFSDTEKKIELQHIRNGCFTHTDNADLVRFDKGNRYIIGF